MLWVILFVRFIFMLKDSLKLNLYIDCNKFEEFKFIFDLCLNEVILYELCVFWFIIRENIFY